LKHLQYSQNNDEFACAFATANLLNYTKTKRFLGEIVRTNVTCFVCTMCN